MTAQYSTGVEQVWSAEPDGGDGLLALVVRHSFTAPGITFFTDAAAPLQLAAVRYPSGHVIPAHVHLPRTRKLETTSEALVMRRGCVRVTFYTSAGREVLVKDLVAGDVCLLLGGGHKVEVTRDETEFFEIKQGPYFGKDLDKRELWPAYPRLP